jgi:hypothetical protein
MCKVDKVVAALTGTDDSLRQKVVLDIGRFTVPLFSLDDKRIELAGTGALFAYRDSKYILTATHVWKEKLRNAVQIGIGIEVDINNRFSIDPQALVPYFPVHPTPWNEWGPDIAFLKIPTELVGSIEARRSFYNPAVDETVAPNVDRVELCVVMGTPHELGVFTPTHADVQVNGRFVVDPIPYSQQGEHDYFDIDIDTSLPGTPKHWGGVSGGGLWLVHVYCECSKDKIEWARSLQGVAF